MLDVVSECWWKLKQTNKQVTIPLDHQGINAEVSKEAETHCWVADF